MGNFKKFQGLTIYLSLFLGPTNSSRVLGGVPFTQNHQRRRAIYTYGSNQYEHNLYIDLLSRYIMSEQIMFGKGVYEMTKDEMRDCIFKLRREVQFQEDCKDCAEDKLKIAESQGFFDGFYFTWKEEAWVRKE